jgi:hypothetical protein
MFKDFVPPDNVIIEYTTQATFDTKQMCRFVDR